MNRELAEHQTKVLESVSISILGRGRRMLMGASSSSLSTTAPRNMAVNLQKHSYSMTKCAEYLLYILSCYHCGNHQKWVQHAHSITMNHYSTAALPEPPSTIWHLTQGTELQKIFSTFCHAKSDSVNLLLDDGTRVLEETMHSQGLTHAQLDACEKEEVEFFATLGKEPSYDVHAVAYVELLQQLRALLFQSYSHPRTKPPSSLSSKLSDREVSDW